MTDEQPSLHPNWLALIRLAEEYEFFDLEHLTFHNGIPMSAELLTAKIRFDKPADRTPRKP